MYIVLAVWFGVQTWPFCIKKTAGGLIVLSETVHNNFEENFLHDLSNVGKLSPLSFSLDYLKITMNLSQCFPTYIDRTMCLKINLFKNHNSKREYGLFISVILKS